MTSTTRRERVRAGMIAEILAAGHKLIASGEPISLRSIARDMGMTPPAMYRYFDSAEAVHQQIADVLLAKLEDEIDAAQEAEIGRIDAGDDPDPVPPIVAVGRRWSTERPGEWRALLTAPGDPVIAMLLDRLEHEITHRWATPESPTVQDLAVVGELL